MSRWLGVALLLLAAQTSGAETFLVVPNVPSVDALPAAAGAELIDRDERWGVAVTRWEAGFESWVVAASPLSFVQLTAAQLGVDFYREQRLALGVGDRRTAFVVEGRRAAIGTTARRGVGGAAMATMEVEGLTLRLECGSVRLAGEPRLFSPAWSLHLVLVPEPGGAAVSLVAAGEAVAGIARAAWRSDHLALGLVIDLSRGAVDLRVDFELPLLSVLAAGRVDPLLGTHRLVAMRGRSR